MGPVIFPSLISALTSAGDIPVSYTHLDVYKRQVVIHDGGPYYIDAFLKNPWVKHLSGGFKRINNGKAREFTEYVATGEVASRLKAANISESYDDYYQGPHWQFASEADPTDLSAAADSIDCTLVDLPFEHNRCV